MTNPIAAIAAILREYEDAPVADAERFARQILQTLREPSTQMVTAGRDVLVHGDPITVEVFQAMIDAALGE